MTGICCCARASSGHVTATPPSSVMNSRRSMSEMPLILNQKAKLRRVYKVGSGERACE
jgi:hypothetical protein